MRRASRDYSKYLRGSEEMGGGPGAPHEGPLHPAPAAPAAPPPPAASRFMFLALLGLGLGQVVCSVALFLYFRAQVSGCLPPPGSLPGETESGPRAGLLGSCLFWKGKRPSKEGNLGSSSQVHPRLLPAVRCAEVELLWFW